MDRRQFTRAVGAAGVLGAAPVAARAAQIGQPDFSGRSIVLGQSAAFSGPASALGSGFRDGASSFFQRVNSEGGIGGRTIDVISLDDGYEPDRTVINTRKLLENPAVTALFGYVGTPTTAAAIPLITEKRMPLIGPFTGAQLLREPLNPNIFNIRASYFDETEKIVELLTVMGHTNIGVFHQNDSFGEAGLKGVQAALDRRKLKLVAVGKVERNSAEVASAVAALGKSSVSAVVMVSAYGSCASFVKAMRAKGQQQTFSSVSFVGSSALRDALGKQGVGVQIAQVVPSPWDMRFPVVREYQRDMKKSGAQESQLDFVSLEGYITARIMVDALRKINGAVTPQAVAASLEKLQWESGDFAVAFAPNRRSGSNFVEMTAIGSDGKFLR
jgi:branched-chain amino acid transport system substrate-binding protein